MVYLLFVFVGRFALSNFGTRAAEVLTASILPRAVFMCMVRPSCLIQDSCMTSCHQSRRARRQEWASVLSTSLGKTGVRLSDFRSEGQKHGPTNCLCLYGCSRCHLPLAWMEHAIESITRSTPTNIGGRPHQ